MVSGIIRSAALAMALSLSVAACGQNNQQQTEAPVASNMTAVTQWAGLVDGTSVTPQADGSYLITASPSVKGYQVGQAIPTAGSTSITLHYDITVQGGPGFIGVLKGDGSSWLNNFDLPANQRSQGETQIAIPGDETVQIVIQTANAAPDVTTFTVHSAQYSLQ